MIFLKPTLKMNNSLLTTKTLLKSAIALLCLALYTNGQSALAQAAHKFHSSELEGLPQYYEAKVPFMKEILNIQDISTSLISVSNPDLFYDYCDERLDANWDEKRKLREFAEYFEQQAIDQHNTIEQNEHRMRTALIQKLHKKSGLEETNAETLAEILDPEINAARRHSREVTRRMLMHEMIWTISDCKKALKIIEEEEEDDQTKLKTEAFFKGSINAYLELVREHSSKTNNIAAKLLKEPKTPKSPPQKPKVNN